jgi:hypothetical protein
MGTGWLNRATMTLDVSRNFHVTNYFVADLDVAPVGFKVRKGR